MDCEKFDRVVLDLLYGELDEITAAAARRHMAHCARCGPIGAGLRATREVGVLPRLPVPEDLAPRILEAERSARASLPLGQRFARGVSVLAGYAMRPQLAMGTVAVLMIGLSLFFVRTRPTDRDAVRITERGVPELDHNVAPATVAARGESQDGLDSAEPVAPPSPVARDSEPSSAAAASTTGAASDDDEFAAANAAFRAGRFAEARASFERIAAGEGEQAATSELMAARSARQAEGCAVGAPLLEDVAARRVGTPVGLEASWDAAECRRALGQTERARLGYRALADEADYAERAAAALAELEENEPRLASRRAKAAAATPPAVTASPSTAAPAVPTTR